MTSDEKNQYSDSIQEQESETFEIFPTNLPEEVVLDNVEDIVTKANLSDDDRLLLTRSARLANDHSLIDSSDIYSEEERRTFHRTFSHPLKSLSKGMILTALTTSFAAVNFGMDESAVGGALLQYNAQFNITNPNMQGFVVASPYLAAGILGLPLTMWLNHLYGRRVVIWISCFIGLTGSLWQAFSNGMPALLVGRLYLGIGMGMNSSTVPIYVAECAPALSRGAVLMLWQTFIALGVCLGSVFNRAFVEIDGSLSWRLMIGSSSVAPLVCGILVTFATESPRWFLARGEVKKSLNAMITLRPNALVGARDWYILHESLKIEMLKEQPSYVQQFINLFKTPRNRFALWVSFLGVFGQQYGGVNILVSYTTTILTGAGIDPVTAIAGSIGIGGGCFLATFVSTQLIDRFGRRTMLLVTLPMEALCLFWLGGALHISDDSARLGAGLTAMYVYVLFYGWGIGPISFILVAETSSMSVRTAHSSLMMSVNWLLDFCLSMTWPKMNESMTTTGGLCFYGGWNAVLVVLVWLFVPETKRFTLEELDEVFKDGALHFARKKLKTIRLSKEK